RPTTKETTDYWRVCLAEDGVRMTTLPTPNDLAHLRPMLIGVGGTMYQGAVDVRGVTVLAGTTNRDGGPADLDGFWQVLRAQIAKVERQP
ncbi:hypothetical protein, partial [Tsukamurella sputi]